MISMRHCVGWVLSVACLCLVPAQAALPKIEGSDVVTHRPVHFVFGQGKPAVVVFLSAQCPCSQDYEPTLASLAAKYPKVSFLGIVPNAKAHAEAVSAHFGKAKLPFAIVSEPGVEWANAFGAVNTPHAFVVRADGKVVYQGGIADSRRSSEATRHYLADALASVSKNKDPAVDKARALGCVIRR